MRAFKVRPLLSICNSQKGYAVLKHLQTFGPKRYSDIGYVLSSLDKNGRYSITAYYLTRLLKHGVLERKIGLYSITKRGSKILKFLETLNVKYLAESNNELCENSSGDCKHTWIKICQNCSAVKPREFEPMPLLEGMLGR